MRKRITIILIFLLVFGAQTFAEKRYVSKTGTSTPPYTSWETAADSIMKAMSLSIQGDTIIVGKGVFTEVVIFNRGVTLVGMGWESTVIKLPEGISNSGAVFLSDWTEISNLKIEGVGTEGYNRGIRGFRSDGQNLNFTIKYLKITNFFGGMSLAGFYLPIGDTLYVHDNVIDSCNEGISTIVNNVIIYNNFISASESALHMRIASACIVHDNVLVSAPYISTYFRTIDGHDNYPARIYNNIVMSLYKTNINISTYGIELGPDTIKNNLLTGNFGVAIRTNGTSTYRDVFNNHISGGGYYGFYGNAPLRFNNFWNNGRHYKTDNGSVVDTISNKIRFPMFVNEEKDYHLQAYSPLIDAGDTLVKDKDGTRSDIGLYGGPFGTIYPYLDLAPLEPRGITATVTGDTTQLNWKRNHESDFKHYLVYGDTTQGFNADLTHLIGTTTDTIFTKIIPGFSGSYYISFKSEDNQGNISDASEEIRVVPVGVKGEGHEVAMDYRLFQNYPNPFNPGTVIGFRLKEEGRVQLTVYTLTGEKIKELRDESLSAGYYESLFTGEGLSSGIYLYKLNVISPQGLPVYTDIKK
ncbi:MAG: right-handed parallel beta-helix repeat-containing protein [Ignavibacteriales bacterium]|nr:right-handed parallel beta-helix repeat-containing protein [Ignavibacteriales bacterium]